MPNQTSQGTKSKSLGQNAGSKVTKEKAVHVEKHPEHEDIESFSSEAKLPNSASAKG